MLSILKDHCNLWFTKRCQGSVFVLVLAEIKILIHDHTLLESCMKSTTLDLFLTMSKPTPLSKMSCNAILHITEVTGSPLFIAWFKRLNLINLQNLILISINYKWLIFRWSSCKTDQENFEYLLCISPLITCQLSQSKHSDANFQAMKENLIYFHNH
jgi:hypothetical protein